MACCCEPGSSGQGKDPAGSLTGNRQGKAEPGDGLEGVVIKKLTGVRHVGQAGQEACGKRSADSRFGLKAEPTGGMDGDENLGARERGVEHNTHTR